jgi:hypothetical protein
MKYLILFLLSTPVMAQTNYHDNRFNGQMTQIYATPIPLTANVNGYYYDSSKQVYYKPKSINRDLQGITPQGNLGWTYNTNQYAPQDLRISK